MGCGVSAPALLGEFESRYAKVIVSDRSATVIAKRFLESVATVMWHDTFSKEPEMVNEDVVLVDNSRIGVYKGDQVHIPTAEKMHHVKQFDTTENGVELHIVLQPQFDLPERFVVSWDSEQDRYSIRHEDPLRVAELSRQVTLSTDGECCSTSPSAATTTSKSSGQSSRDRHSRDIDFFEPERSSLYTTEEPPKLATPKQIHNARLYRRLSEDLQKDDFGVGAIKIKSLQKLELQSVDYKRLFSVDFGDDPPEESRPQKPVLQRRHSLAGHEFQDSIAFPTRQRRHSASGTESLPEQYLMQQFDASLSPKSPQLQRRHSMDALLSPKYSQQQRRPSLSGAREMPLDASLTEPLEPALESSPCQRHNSDPSIQLPDKIGRFAAVNAQQRPRRRSIA